MGSGCGIGLWVRVLASSGMVGVRVPCGRGSQVGWVRRNSSAGSKWYGCGGTFEDLKFIGLSSGV